MISPSPGYLASRDAAPVPGPAAGRAGWFNDRARTRPAESWAGALRRSGSAVLALYLLGLIGLVALFAEFFAPYASQYRDEARLFCPPQMLRFSLPAGFHALAWGPTVDAKTLEHGYVEDPHAVIPLGFFVSGQEYRPFGLFALHRHFFGVKDATGGEPATVHLLGTDKYGRDILSRLIFGCRISLSVGLVSLAVMVLLGLGIGGLSGYIGGTTDNLVQRGIEIINSLPQIPIWMAFSAMIPDDWSPLAVYVAIMLALSLVGWTGLARVVRGRILSLREEDYVAAARISGASHARILFRHLMPALTGHVIAVLVAAIPEVILGETTLSFLGLGLRAPVVSWGVMLQDAADLQRVERYPWLLAPVVAIAVTILAFNLLGERLRRTLGLEAASRR